MTLKNNWVNGDFVGADDLNATATQVNTNTGDITAVASGKADKSRTITAGAGLTGGGDLTANRTLAADFGTGAGKVCQGNDPRLSDPRTPGDNTVTTAKLQDSAVTTGKIASSVWTDRPKIIVGTTAPGDTTAVWIDTN